MDEITGIDLGTPERLPAARPSVVFGTEWNAWRSGVMPQPPKKFRKAQKRPGIRDLSLTALQYPAGATGQGFTSGRVGLGHVTSSEWQEVAVQRLPVARPVPRLSSPPSPKTGGSTEPTAR